ncbi:MAG TPA: fdxN element excision recombinase XisF [Allocoleopsis sp.]
MKRVIGYTRISSKSPEQLHALEQHKARLKEAGCTEIYYDIASRSCNDRKGLNTVLDFIQHGECDQAIFIRVDRMTDSPTVLERAINICLASGIPIQGLDDSIDFTTVGGRLHARILCNLAKAEVERLAERVKNGHQHHRNRNAAYFAPLGYVKVDDSLELDHIPFLCLIDEKQVLSRAAIGRDLIETFLKTRSLRRTLREFNSKYGLFTHATKGSGNRQARGKLGFHPSGLTSWLNNPILRGHLAYGRSYKQRQSYKDQWDIRYNTHPEHRLMSDEEYSQIEEILDWNAKHGKNFFPSGEVHPLSGLIQCGECRGYCGIRNFRSRTTKKKTYFYQCSNYQLKACPQKRGVRESVLEQAIIDALITRAAAITTVAELPPEHIDPPELKALKAELAYYQAAPGNRAAEIVADLHHQIENFHHETRNQSEEVSANRELLLRVFRDSLFWQTLLPEEKRDIYRKLVDRVTMKNREVVSVTLKV